MIARNAPGRRHPGRVVAVIFAVVVAIGGGIATWLAAQGWGQAVGQDVSPLPPATAEVTRQTLTSTTTFDGELGYGVAATTANRLTGTITALPEIGDVIKQGKPLYSVDDQPVILLYGDLPAYRTLAEDAEGPDVEQLERNLEQLGYDGFTVDDEYTWRTAQAVEEWQEDLGVEETGTVEPGRVVFLTEARRISALDAQLGAAATPGQPVLSHTATAKAVTVQLEPSDLADVEVGATVEVELPDGATVPAKINELSTEVVAGSGQDAESTTVVTAVAQLTGDKAAQAAADYDQAAVELVITTGERKDVLTVPVIALLALSGGGYGLEVVAGGASSYVEVDTGLFAAGRVEVEGDGIAAGTVVGMPE
ncbi:peptidoglycan-binding protein [Microlunatus speluncae]|uniref:peptidoglycan-binding protein n=1 Tax=Microlunatus speluncae TaxID=2594267 RepID=UPI001FE450C8|nr:peptidoglycan-binding protein [Microlunatus speluncae]